LKKGAIILGAVHSVSHQYTGQCYPSHFHNEHQMIFVASGQVRMRVSFAVYEVTAPAVLLLSNLEPHSVEAVTGEYERYTVTISPEGALGVLDDRLLSGFIAHSEEFPRLISLTREDAVLLSALFRLLEEEYGEETPPDGKDDILSSILLRLYRRYPASFPTAQDGMAKVVSSVRRILEQDLSEKLPLSALAAQFHVSVYHLERVFRAQTGYSLARYRMLCRLAAAREMLASTELSVGDISAAVGIGDMSNFSRYFKREMGMTPLTYRKRYRDGDMSE